VELFDPHFFIVTLALLGAVIIIAALLSGIIDRSDIPQVGVFLALGAMLGPAGLGMLNVTLQSPIVQIVAILSLVLVLFTDAVSLSISEMRRQAGLAFRVLGPGTLLSAGLIAFAAIFSSASRCLLRRFSARRSPRRIRSCSADYSAGRVFRKQCGSDSASKAD